MVALDAQYPQYGFAQHKGYGVPAHMEAIARQGPCPQHRRSFEPVKGMTGWSRERMLAEEAAGQEGKEEGKEAKSCGDVVEAHEAKRAHGIKAKAARGAAADERRQGQEGDEVEGLGKDDGEGQKVRAERAGASGKASKGAARGRAGKAGKGRALGAKELGADLAGGSEDQGAAKRPRRSGKGQGTGRGLGQGGTGQGEEEADAEQQEAVAVVAVAEAESPGQGEGADEGGPRERVAGRKRGPPKAAEGPEAAKGEAAPQPPKRLRRAAARVKA